MEIMDEYKSDGYYQISAKYDNFHFEYKKDKGAEVCFELIMNNFDNFQFLEIKDTFSRKFPTPVYKFEFNNFVEKFKNKESFLFFFLNNPKVYFWYITLLIHEEKVVIIGNKSSDIIQISSKNPITNLQSQIR